ncbi:MAG: hypothetical protein D3924_01170 [Candidatus Electrothrix sp. AR4]|nr:hypothetical protein [Candidatus Electrothrix sp. AR4]
MEHVPYPLLLLVLSVRVQRVVFWILLKKCRFVNKECEKNLEFQSCSVRIVGTGREIYFGLGKGIPALRILADIFDLAHAALSIISQYSKGILLILFYRVFALNRRLLLCALGAVQLVILSRLRALNKVGNQGMKNVGNVYKGVWL